MRVWSVVAFVICVAVLGVMVVVAVTTSDPVGRSPTDRYADCEAAIERFGQEHPEILLTLADCGPYYRRRPPPRIPEDCVWDDDELLSPPLSCWEPPHTPPVP